MIDMIKDIVFYALVEYNKHRGKQKGRKQTAEEYLSAKDVKRRSVKDIPWILLAISKNAAT